MFNLAKGTIFRTNIGSVIGIANTSLFNINKKFFGKNEKAIKLRIKSITSIEKITKAMKMVNKKLKKSY
jgi:hypothetical protein